MKSQADQETKKLSETIGKMFRKFGDSVGEIMDDPEVRAKAKAFAESVVDAAAKVGQNKVKNEEVRAKYRDVGKAAQTLGNSLEKHFNSAEQAGE
jgi:ribosomal-protein-alanine N-acetyltransferase